jgi:hypothetical protein
LFLSGQFGNNIGIARPDILADIMLKFWPVEMFLQHCHCIFDAEVSSYLTVVGFPNHLRSLALWNAKVAQMTQQPVLKMEIREN